VRNLLLTLPAAPQNSPAKDPEGHEFHSCRSGPKKRTGLQAPAAHSYRTDNKFQNTQVKIPSCLQSGKPTLCKKNAKGGPPAKVTEISAVENEQTVYNFEVEDNHDYFVGPGELLVHNAGTCAFGNDVHQGLQKTLSEQTGTNPEDWQMATAPGQTGVDATYVGDPSTNPGFNYVELKPVGYSDTAVGNQISNWGLPEGQTSIWWYNSSGIIGQTFGFW